MQKAGKTARHGDLNFLAVDKMPAKAKEVSSFVLAEGEQTGHNHTIQGRVAVLEHENTMYMQVFEDSVLTHPEHKKITFEPGVYKVWKERERDPYLAAIRTVRD